MVSLACPASGITSIIVYPLFEEIGMGAGTFEDNLELVCPIDQQPIRFNMAFPSILEIADQRMIPIFAIKRFPFDQLPHDGFDMIRIASALDHPLQVFAKAFCINWCQH
jgi:hypothetical protein